MNKYIMKNKKNVSGRKCNQNNYWIKERRVLINQFY